MHRRPLIDLLLRYGSIDRDCAAIAQRFLEFVRRHDDCLLRSCVPGHITASAWILAADHRQCLLTHHRKLDRWLQLGGHVDGESHVARSARREAQEESGMHDFDLLAPGGSLLARGSEGEHLHWDVRFLLRAHPGQPLVISSESKALRWIDVAALPTLTNEPSVLRLPRTAEKWLAHGVAVVPADSIGDA